MKHLLISLLEYLSNKVECHKEFKNKGEKSKGNNKILIINADLLVITSIILAFIISVMFRGNRSNETTINGNINITISDLNIGSCSNIEKMN